MAKTELLKLSCPNCKASLECNLDNLMAYCPYCRQKLVVDVDNLDKVLGEKEKTTREKIKEDGKTERKKIELDYQEKSFWSGIRVF